MTYLEAELRKAALEQRIPLRFMSDVCDDIDTLLGTRHAGRLSTLPRFFYAENNVEELWSIIQSVHTIEGEDDEDKLVHLAGRLSVHGYKRAAEGLLNATENDPRIFDRMHDPYLCLFAQLILDNAKGN